MTFAPVEDELGAPSPKDAQAFNTMVDELNGLVAWSQAYAQSPYVSLYPGFTVILARIVLSERWSRLQAFGLLAALVAVVLVSVGSA